MTISGLKMAQAIAAQFDDAMFCFFEVFQKDGEWKKKPLRRDGSPGVGADTPPKQLVSAVEVLAGSVSTHGQYWGVVMQHPVLDFLGNALTVLDLDGKHCPAGEPYAPGLTALKDKAKDEGWLREVSHSHKGAHIMLAAPPDAALPAKVNVGTGQDVEIFGHPDSPGKSVMLTDTKLEGELRSVYSVADVLTELGISLTNTTGEGGDRTIRDDATDFERQASLCSITPETLLDLRSSLLDGLPAEWAEDRTRWVDVGLSLKSLDQAGYATEALDLWHQFSQRCPEKYDVDECEKRWEGFDPTKITYKSIFEWAQKAGWVNPRKKLKPTAETRQDHTDAGNMALLAKGTAGNLRYVTELKDWLFWDGHRWDPGAGAAAQSAALQVGEYYTAKAEEIRAQANQVGLEDGDRRRLVRVADSVAAWAKQCRNKNRIDNMLNLAKGDSRFALPVNALDQDPYLFGVANGVVDLRTGTLRPAGRDDYVTRRSPVGFVPGARGARWELFIDEITSEPGVGGNGFKPRPAVAAYLQRALGYGLTGSTAEHKMFMAIGDGSNGKNVLLDLLQWLMGDYCETIAPEALMASKHDADAERPTPGARKLAGARLAISSESKDGQKLDVALVKRHTGGGYLTARGMHENSFRFEITHKLWLMTNHKPALDHMDDAMRGRLHMIPFSMRWNRPGHPERNPLLPDGDKTLPGKLKAEPEGVLSWLISGAVAYLRDGLEPPPEVANMTRSYFQDQDQFAMWSEGYRACPVNEGVRASDLFSAYRDWCVAEGLGVTVAGSQNSFAAKLTGMGVVSRKLDTGRFYGLQKVPESEDLV
jgi:putative DNA primase/helicase